MQSGVTEPRCVAAGWRLEASSPHLVFSLLSLEGTNKAHEFDWAWLQYQAATLCWCHGIKKLPLSEELSPSSALLLHVRRLHPQLFPLWNQFQQVGLLPAAGAPQLWRVQGKTFMESIFFFVG